MNQSNRRPVSGSAPAHRPPQRQSAHAPARRPAARSAGGASVPQSRDRALPVIAIAGVIVIVLAYFLQRAWPNGWPLEKKQNAQSNAAITEIHSGGVRINEVMSSNKSALTAQDGTAPDWIEIMNASGSAQNLAGYSLAKRANAANVFTFPDITLQPEECVIVFADSRLRDTAGEELHAPFGISAAGDTLLLFNPSGTAIDTVNLPALRGDEAYARVARDAWEKTFEITPGLSNTAESYRQLHTADGSSPVIITELMAVNATTLQDETGCYSDYIEITNRSGATVDLTGWYLSDSESNPYKWRFPQVMIEPEQSIIVFASGFNRTEDPAHLHTNFSLSGEGECVVLSDAQGRRMDIVEFGLMQKDQAWTRQTTG